MLLGLAVTVVLVATVAVGDAHGEPRTVVPVAPMTVARAVHTATRLASGDVLIVGGCTSRGCELGGDEGKTAELYDWRSGRFTPIGRLNQWRDDHVSSRLRDGRVLVAGGWGARGVIATSEIYDPTTGRFRPGPTMRSRRAGATATELLDGRVLIAGGFTDNRPTIARAEVFEPKREAFREVGHMRTARGAHSAARLRDGRVLLVGGFSKGRVVASTEIFDPRTGRFARGPAMASSRYKAAAVTLRDGRVLVLGGSADVDGDVVYRTTEIYDPKRNAFSAGPPMQRARYKLNGSVALLPDGSVFVAGGGETPERLPRTASRFQPVAGKIDRARQFLTATLLPDGGVLLVGGYDRDVTPTGQAWRY